MVDETDAGDGRTRRQCPTDGRVLAAGGAVTGEA
jgi:hypothetical protein